VRAPDGNTFTLPRGQAHAQGELIVGLRPEHLSICLNGADDTAMIEGIVSRVEHLGAEVQTLFRRTRRHGGRLALRR
jgi:hypothetical protein